MRRLSVLLLLAAMLAGCGFHLRGHGPVPDGMGTVAIRDADQGSSNITWYSGGRDGLRRELARSLTTAGFTVSDGAPLTIQLISDSVRRRTASIDASASAAEYQIDYEVRFRVTGSDGAELIPATLLRTDSSYRFDESAVLGSAEQEALLYEDMRREIARRIVDQFHRRVTAAGHAPAP
ncbi:MAG: LPS assembly lipoprotein LptE [Pseudomonadota bacterium]